jgi:hypothetical protein
MTAQRKLLDALQKAKGAKFASFVYRSKETQELSKYVVLLGFNTRTLYENDRDKLVASLDNFAGLDKEAATAILTSINESLTKGIGNNSAYTHGPEQADTYLHVDGLPNVTFNKNDGVLHIKALVVSKEVIEPGEYKEVKSRPLTLAKKSVSKALDLRREKVRQFALTNINEAKVNGDTIVFS